MSSSRDIYFHTPSANQTSYDPFRDIGLRVYNVHAFAVFDKFVWFFFWLILSKSSATDLKCFWPFNCKKLPAVKQKLNLAIGVD